MEAQRHQGPLPASVAMGRVPIWKEPRWGGGNLLWLEQRPQEGGRTTLLLRSGPDREARELTPAPWDLRSRVHDYGGGVYTHQAGTVVFVAEGDRCLWRLDLPADPQTDPIPAPERLTAPARADAPRAFADGFIDSQRNLWVGVMEQGGRDWLVAVPLAGGEPRVLRAAADFCGYAVASPCGTALAWVEWQRPFMPWQRSQLWCGEWGEDGGLNRVGRIAGSDGRDPTGISVFQPLWLDRGDLVVSCDRSGWWNLELLEAATDPDRRNHEDPEWRTLLPMRADFAMPQWVYGMRTIAWDGHQLVAAACEEGRWSLGRIQHRPPSPRTPEEASGRTVWQPLDLPFDDLASLDAADGRLVAIAASGGHPRGLLEVDLGSGAFLHTPSAPLPIELATISQPRAIWFPGWGGRPTHAWYYPPIGGASPGSPLLVKGHSGPTAMAGTGLSLLVQFWTSRGWGVVDVNYGGSTGFGRAYRERLDGHWGEVDVEDCAAAARYLAARGWADAGRVAIEGSSASGFTVLAALCFTDVFRAGACRYGIADLAAMARDTHRFEACYLETLIGPMPAAERLYAERSPLLHADRIRCPVILFQGLDDRVVPPQQTERMAEVLRGNGLPVEVHLFPGEGHGFRDGEIQIRVLELTEAFFRRHLEL